MHLRWSSPREGHNVHLRNRLPEFNWTLFSEVKRKQALIEWSQIVFISIFHYNRFKHRPKLLRSFPETRKTPKNLTNVSPTSSLLQRVIQCVSWNLSGHIEIIDRMSSSTLQLSNELRIKLLPEHFSPSFHSTETKDYQYQIPPCHVTNHSKNLIF